VSATRRLCQARLRQAGEQYVAEAGCPTPTVHDAPHSGQLDVTPAWTASVLTRARRIRRQCRDRQTDEQNTAVALADGINGPPHFRHSLGPVSSSVTTTSFSWGTRSLRIRPPYESEVAQGTPLIHVRIHGAAGYPACMSGPTARKCATAQDLNANAGAPSTPCRAARTPKVVVSAAP
jgi:hypothetical protein